MNKRFLVALSFPGEKRVFVEAVANALADVITKERVLYDLYLQPEFARPNLDLYLEKLYHDEAELIVLFLCADYERKEWCGLEWRQIRDLRKQRKDDQIMPFRFDDAPIPGVLSIDGYVAIKDSSPQQVANAILERLALVGVAEMAAKGSPKGVDKGNVAKSEPAGMEPEEKQNACLNLLMLLAQAYYKLLESSIGGPCGAIDLELNQSYLWTVSSIEKLLANNDGFGDFPGPFSPIFSDLFPTTVQDVDWQDMVAPHAEQVLSTIQRYVLEKGMHSPEEKSPGWCFVELYRPSIDLAIARAMAYEKRMREHWQAVLKNVGDLQKKNVPNSDTSGSRSPSSTEPSLVSLRKKVPAGARRVLTRIWNEYLRTDDWPEMIAIHAELDKAKVTRVLEPLDRSYVRTCNFNSRGKKVYELGLLGILCTERGTKYLGFLERYLNFLRDLHYGGRRPELFDYATLRAALNLSPDEGKELGRIIQSGFFFGGGGTGNNPEQWTFSFPDDADDLPRKKSVRPWIEKFILKRCLPVQTGTTIGYAVPLPEEEDLG